MKGRPWAVAALVGALVGAVAPALAGDRQTTVEVTAQRTLMSALPNIAVGGGFVSGGDLLDGTGRAKVGEGHSHCGVLAVSTAVPPEVRTHCTSVFRLGNDELHLSSLRTYKSLDAGFENTTMAITGGTGKYANARGQGQVTRNTAAQVSYRYVLTVVTE
ncbi:hypothetical protein LZG04_26400 [Saccharothrix sp. S26]|uniref:hypothetical protein n=1 Tax=Saccharothrix sp. S26 TaxID=2907215 RepID=UPI001F1C51F3|nr:hypothetical protein [Saccharothrix sp. S26]MCE6998302.1 hypothetical protein [Saccharothrix sp. S26]